MANYDFSTLSSSDFEELSCDLMNAQQSAGSLISYKTFKDGKDKGIDFLYSTEENVYEHVGQVKHYYRSGFANLLSTLKNTELDKIKKLKPNKYIVFTSVDLAVGETEAIQNALNPFIKTLNDVYGKKDINQLLEKHSSVLDNHFKLWFSDTSVLQKILKSGLEFRSSDFIKNEIERRISLYVKTKNFDSARTTLHENKSIIITGEPGVGKTMLAEMLCYEFIKNDYKLHYLSKITEFETLIQPDDSKQIFYFDDFLGSNKIEINKAKESETDLVKILRRISKLENKFFVFTTRSFLFNTAIDESENLKRLNVKSKEQIFNMLEYGIELKREILKNHIECSELDITYKEILEEKKVFSFIVEHNNFFPRSVEFITNKEVVKEIDIEKFRKFIFDNFNFPSEIYQHAYRFQIYEDDRILLNTLFSFGVNAKTKELEKAFYNRLQYEAENNNKKNESDAFNSSLKRLLGGFIREKDNKTDFLNPSIIDFLELYLLNNVIELKKIGETVCFSQQLTERLFQLSHKVSANQIIVPESLKFKLLNNYTEFLTKDNRDLDLLRIALVIFKYVKEKDYIEVVTEILYEISDWKDLYDNYEINLHFREFLDITSQVVDITNVILERLTEFAVDLIKGERDLFIAMEMLDKIIFQYNIEIKEINKEEFENYFNDLLNEYIYNELEDLQDYITYENEATEKISEIQDIIDRLEKLGLKIDSNLDDYSGYDWEEIALDNEYRRLMEKDD